MIDKTYHRKDTISYVELMARTQGPFVGENAAVFASDWYNETSERLTHFVDNALPSPRGKTVAQILPSGPGYSYQNNLKYFVSLIHTATKSVVITNPYLVPDESLLAAIISVAQRGVKVSILNSEVMDQWMVGHAQRSYYKELMQAGVTISLYPSPQLLHSKYMVVDQQVAIVGSSNLDVRSFELDLECVSIFYDSTVAKKLYAQHMSDQQKSSVIDPAKWRGRGIWTEFLDSLARLTSALQ
jgi:cardiolipin synthase